jgi:hypothetical protein
VCIHTANTSASPTVSLWLLLNYYMNAHSIYGLGTHNICFEYMNSNLARYSNCKLFPALRRRRYVSGAVATDCREYNLVSKVTSIRGFCSMRTHTVVLFTVFGKYSKFHSTYPVITPNMLPRITLGTSLNL